MTKETTSFRASKLEEWEMRAASRLKILFDEKTAMTQIAFGARFGIGTAGMVSQYLNGKRPLGLSAAVKFSNGLGVTVAEISPVLAEQQAKLAGSAQAIDLTNNPEYPTIRRARFRLSAGASGFGVEYDEEDEAPIVFRRQWFEREGYSPDKLIAMRVSNGSMEPGLHHGDTVVVNTADTNIKDGEVFAMNYEGELVIKRLVRDAGEWWLSSDNPDQRRYPRKLCSGSVSCLGRIVHKQSMRI